MQRYLDIPITVVVTAIVTVAMLWPITQPPPGPDWSDKVLHVIAFTALSFPLALTGRFGLIPVFIGASAFGSIIEILQPWFGRSADILDWVADILGVVFGVVLALFYRWLRKLRV